MGTIASFAFLYYLNKKKKDKKHIKKTLLLDLIGKTPLIYLPKLSSALNCEIYVSS